jgi:hypothetical protein
LRHVLLNLAAILAVLIAAPQTVAHGGASPTLIVTVDHVDPGTSVPLVAADFGSDSLVQFKIVAPAKSVELGHLTAGPDGHFTASFDIPADFPVGWADVVGTGDDGSSSSTQVLIGPTSGAPPRPNRAAPWWQDPSIWLLAAFVLGAVVVGVWFVFRSRAPKVVGRRRPSR